jgi:hypothetical protein
MNRSDRTGLAVYGVLTTVVLAAAVVSAVMLPATVVPVSAAAQAVPRVAARAGPDPAAGVTSADSPDSEEPVASLPWRLVMTGHYGSPIDASGYSAVIAPARNDAWVFGGTNPGASSQPVAERWNGRIWHAALLPGGLGSFISGASASGQANVWAVSSFGGYVLRWNGNRWSVARTWNPAAQATCITAISPTDVWLFGAPGDGGQGTGTWRFDGHTWTRITGPGSAVYRASAISRRSIWGITAGPRGGSVERWDGRGWHRIRTGSALAGTRLDDVLATSPRSVWVVANFPASAADGHIVVARWNGRTWRRYEARGLAIPRRLAADGHGGIWLTAMTLGSQTESRLLHLSRSGRWTQTAIARGLGNSISDLALVPGTWSLWGSGGFLTASGGDAAIWLRAAGPSSDPR